MLTLSLLFFLLGVALVTWVFYALLWMNLPLFIRFCEEWYGCFDKGSVASKIAFGNIARYTQGMATLLEASLLSFPSSLAGLMSVLTLLRRLLKESIDHPRSEVGLCLSWWLFSVSGAPCLHKVTCLTLVRNWHSPTMHRFGNHSSCPRSSVEAFLRLRVPRVSVQETGFYDVRFWDSCGAVAKHLPGILTAVCGSPL